MIFTIVTMIVFPNYDCYYKYDGKCTASSFLSCCSHALWVEQVVTHKNVLRIGSLSQDLGSKRWLLITKLPWWMDTSTQQGIVRRYVSAISHILDLGISLTFGVVLCAMVKSPYNREWPSHLCQEILIKNIYKPLRLGWWPFPITGKH